MRISYETDLPDEFFSDVLVTAFDGQYGGCWYWARPDETDTGPDAFTIEGDTWRSVRVVEREASGDTARAATVDHEMIAKGITRLLIGEVKVNERTRGYILHAVADNDCGRIDSEAADCIVQAGMFGALVYG